MYSAFTSVCRYENSIIKHIGNVYCSNKMCSVIVCVHKKTFQCIGGGDYHCLQCASTCQVRVMPFKEQTNSLFLKFGKGNHIFEETQKSVQDDIGDVFCPTCPYEKCIHLSTNKISVSTTVKSAKSAFTFWIFLLRTRKREFCCLVVMVTLFCQENESWPQETKTKQKPFPFLKLFAANHNLSHPFLNQKKAKTVSFMA